jgi:dTDP-4-dehydrorhamnose reductase
VSKMRLVVTGLSGQIVSALIERAPREVELIALGRPQLDLSIREAVLAGLHASRADVILNAAAYTAVDKAESEPELAMRVNGDGAGYVAEIAAELGKPLLHLSTDYVFDGALDRPYRETDAPCPIGAYGRSKLAGEAKIAAICANAAIVRNGWVFSPFGDNFVKTMLKLGVERAEIGVVADQIGNPTSALDIADALLVMAARLATDSSSALRGVFHMASADDASWATLARAIFVEAEKSGRAPVRIRDISTADYPTAARRLANARLDCAKLRDVYGIPPPLWKTSLPACIARVLGGGAT